jgi:hypothetical protein
MGAATAAGATPTNIALHKSCSVNLKPNYNLKNSELADLTDGIKPEGTSVGWISKGMVGWSAWIRKAKTVQITVDLGTVQPIGGVALWSAGGGGVVSLPESIVIQTSEDGKTFLTVGDLVELDENAPIPVHSEDAFHNFVTHQLRTKGRYVRFMCIVPQSLISCGEVEVFKGDDALLNEPAQGHEMTEDQVVAPLRLTQLGVRRRVLQDVQLVRQEMKKAAGAVPVEAGAALDRLEKEAKQQVYPQKIEGFEAQWPVNDLDRQIFAVRGQWLGSRGLPAMTLWRTPTYQTLDLMAEPPAAADAAGEKITLAMMVNERRARSFNLTNASDHARRVQFRLAGLPGNHQVGLKVYEVQWLDTRYGRPRDLALLPIEARDDWYEVNVPAGFTQEIWLSCRSHDVKPGRYEARIEAKAGQWSGRLPLELVIAPVNFPDRADFTLTMWDYIFDKERGVTAENRSAVKKLFLDGMGNMPWKMPIRSGEIAHFGRDGNLAGKVDYSGWDAFVKYWGDMRHLAVSFDPPDFPLGSPQLETAVSSFAADWAKHNKQLGLKPGQVVVSFQDEPQTDAQFALCEMLSKAFGKGTRDILIITNPMPTELGKLPHAEPAMKLADIIMPPRIPLDRSWELPLGKIYQSLAQEGKTFWTYSCYGSKDFPPSYYRVQPWALFAQFGTDGNGGGFWSMGDSRVSSNWNDYTAYGTVDFAAIYLASDRVATSKLWEAAREGVEDWQYLKMLADAGHAAEAGEIARDCYEQLRKTYGPAYYGQNDKSNSASALAEKGRLEALRLLSRQAQSASIRDSHHP